MKMKLLFIVFSGLCQAVSAFAEGPEIRWLETVHDFGAFDESVGMVTTTFKAVNTGTEPLVIFSARANCGCTTPQYNQDAIEPGDTLSLSVSYDAKGRPGRFDKKVYVSSNAEKNSVLTIKGTVIGASNSLKGRYPIEGGKIRLSSSILPFGEVKKGHTVNAMIRGYNASEDTLRPTVTNLPAYMKFTVRPEAVLPGEQFALSGVVSTADYPMWGLVTDSITVIADASKPALGKVNISTVVIVNEDFSNMSAEDKKNAPVVGLVTEMYDMDKFGWSDAGITINSKIFNNGKNPLEIHRVYSPDPSIEVSVAKDKIKGGKNTDFVINIYPEKIPAGEPLNARVTLITNDPVTPTKIIRIVGEVNRK